MGALLRDLPLADAFRDARGWMDRFDRWAYPKAFEEYSARFGPVYAQALSRVGEDGLEALADALLDTLEEGWKRQSFWSRSTVRYHERQVVVLYLSPMLLGMEDPAPRLAGLLRERWAARRPGDGYEIADYRTIRRGFRNTILGMELSRTDDEDDRDPPPHGAGSR